MAEKVMEGERNGCGGVAVDDIPNETLKRCSSASPRSAPPPKSPRTDSPSPTAQTSESGEVNSEAEKPDMQTGISERAASPPAQRKSWRRATITRRSLPSLPNPYQALCKSISPSLSQQERLEKLLEASMKLAMERTRDSLQSVPKASLDSFQKQVEHIQTECGCLAKNIRSEPPRLLSCSASSSETTVKRAMENVQRAINRLQAESESWEALLNKHQSKAEELEGKVERGQKSGISLNSTCIAQSSQYAVIQSKPDYHSLLSRQKPMLHSMAMIMDTQCKMIRELLSIKDKSHLVLKETSGRLAEEAGFQDISSDPLRNLMSANLPTTAT
ncbi:kinetochore-associated protein DSN1 homolog [Cololabis saira]|uniref:kinetochore-associated protein DSN1 homolog n=1 Tax=Cololabis saira TaxID=129043 RepID=UPI002AD32CA2|nr:kinetochore-associated protein DSN1 homolog [Cololabis saira]